MKGRFHAPATSAALPCHMCLPEQTEIHIKPDPTPLKNTYLVLLKLVDKGVFIKSVLLKEITAQVIVTSADTQP